MQQRQKQNTNLAPNFGETTNYYLYKERNGEASSPTLKKNISSNSVALVESNVESEKDQNPRKWCTCYKVIEIVLILACLAISILLTIDLVDLYHINLVYVDPQVGDGSLLLNLVGDSLIHHPYMWFDLPGRINFFVNDQFTIKDYGVDGDTISEIAARINTTVYNPTPDAVVLFWDSDCSNINEYAMTASEVNQTRESYINNLVYVINTTLSAGVKYMAVGGPELLGEGIFLHKHLFWRKVDMLNDYRAMNQQVTAEWNVTYIDVRHEFLKDIPWYWAYSQWYETVDGEHENARGARHVGRLFGQALYNWLLVYNSTLLVNNAETEVALVNR